MKTVLIRADVSVQTGSGHLRRCLVLAQALKAKGCRIAFLCRARDFDWRALAAGVDECMDLDWEVGAVEDAARVVELYRQLRADAAVIDHYHADDAYQRRLLDGGIRWLQFDGFMRQNFWADWILNANPNADEKKYKALLKRPQTQLLLGTSFALLRQEYGELQVNVTFRPKVQNILLTFGGGDDRGASVFCLEALKRVDPQIGRIVVLTKHNPHYEAIRAWSNHHPQINVRLCVDAPDVAKVMSEADLAVISGGTTVFETAALGIPSLIIAIAGNQEVNGPHWEQTGASLYLKRLDNLKAQTLHDSAMFLINDSQKRARMSETAKRLVDCRGASRVADILKGTAPFKGFEKNPQTKGAVPFIKSYD